MTESLTIRTAQDVINIVPRILGFTPQDSLVVLGTGRGAPSARIDLSDKIGDALAPALPYWVGQTVVVLVYTADVAAWRRARRAHASWLPGVNVADVIHVEPASEVGPTGSSLDAVSVAETRDDLRRLYDGASDDALVTIAAQAWRAGAGATTWVGIDIARERGLQSAVLDRLADALEAVVRPTDEALALILGEEA